MDRRYYEGRLRRIATALDRRVEIRFVRVRVKSGVAEKHGVSPA